MRTLLLTLALAVPLSACGSEDDAPAAPPPATSTPEAPAAPPPPPTLDRSDPAQVATAITTALGNGDYEALRGLCDPMGENDRESQNICDLADNPEFQAQVAQIEGPFTVNGPAVIEGSEAGVPVTLGSEGDETLEFINRDGSWYFYNL